MNKLNYAFAMLTAAGGAVALSPAAHAVTLYGSFTNGGLGYAETFQLQSDGGVADAMPHYTDFALTNDSLGNTLATVGDDTTGLKSEMNGMPIDGYFGTGPAGSVPFGGQTFDSLKPALYDSSQTVGVLQPGTYIGDFDGFTLVLSTGAVPEPDAWALLIAGAAMVGGAVRASRKRALVAA